MSRAELWEEYWGTANEAKQKQVAAVAEAQLTQCRAHASNLADQVAALQEKLQDKDKEIEKLNASLLKYERAEE